MINESTSRVGTIKGYLQRLDQIERQSGGVLFFRGHAKTSYKLVPSIYRNKGWISNEAAMLNELILRCPNEFSSGLSTFQTLVRMQHYSLPTRLLDITSNPLVALYFACETDEDSKEEDGAVFAMSQKLNEVKYFDSDTVSVIANISRRPADFQLPGSTTKAAFNRSKQIELLLHDIRQDKPYFKAAIEPTHPRTVLCVKPKLDNPRIVRQEGAFLIFGVDGIKSRPAEVQSTIDIEKILINKNRKADLLLQLERLGISKASLFPEIDQVSLHIRAIYEAPDLNPDKLEPTQRKVFMLLSKGAGVTVKDVSTKLKIDVDVADMVIGQLSKRKVIERVSGTGAILWRARQSDSPDADRTIGRL